MNYYVVVEGRSGEKKVYPKWLKILAPKLTQVYSVGDIRADSYYLISGDGYPQYLCRVQDALDDCKNYRNIDVLVIAVDSEEASYKEKHSEISDFVRGKIEPERVRIVIQHPCLETWALGNRIVCRRNPQNVDLRRYLKIYDVRISDPEDLPALPSEGLNRCQFAFKYLKRMLNDRHPNLTYTKSNPYVIEHEKYFKQIQIRLEETGHIQSFESFMESFKGA